jgi:hypothetical protein
MTRHSVGCCPKKTIPTKRLTQESANLRPACVPKKPHHLVNSRDKHKNSRQQTGLNPSSLQKTSKKQKRTQKSVGKHAGKPKNFIKNDAKTTNNDGKIK